MDWEARDRELAERIREMAGEKLTGRTMKTQMGLGNILRKNRDKLVRTAMEVARVNKLDH